MTGGKAVILGETGRNFGAGMSGGEAYVYDPKNIFEQKCNLDTFELEELSDDKEIEELKKLIENHFKYTDSNIAKDLLADWSTTVNNFIKVMPTDYKRVLEEINLRKQAV